MKKNILLASVLSIYLLYCFLIAFVAPIFIKPIISEQAKNYITGHVELKSLGVNPLTNTITLEGLNLKNSQGFILASFDELSVNIELLPFILLNAQINELEINQLQLFTGEVEENIWLEAPQLLISDTSVAINRQEVSIQEVLINKLKLSPVLTNEQSINIELFLTEIEHLLISDDETITDSSVTIDSETSAEITVAEDEQHNSSTSTEVTTTSEKVDETPWLVHITLLELKSANISLLDQSISNEQSPEGIRTTITPINIKLGSIHSDFSQDINVKIDAQVLKGKLNLKGKVNPNTMASQIIFTANELQLAELNPYIEHFSFASITSGTFSTEGSIESVQVEQEPILAAEENSEQNQKDLTKEKVLEVKVTNSSKLQTLSVKHQNFESPLLQCDGIESKALNFSLLEQALWLENITLTQCIISPYIDEKGLGNFDLAKVNQEKDSPLQSENDSEKTKAQSLLIDIKLVELINNAINIEDFSQGDKVSIAIQKIQARVENIAAGKNDLTRFQLDATLNNHAPLLIKGDGNFINEKISTQSKVTLDNLGLKSFSPYTLNLSGRPIDKGALSLDLDINLLENQLDSKSHIALKGLELGKKQNYEGASKLPIALALGILKDSKNEINIKVPVKGDIDDPSFSITGQVIKTLTGIITKAATAPLSMVGGLVSGSDNTDEQKIIFEEDSSLITELHKKRIEKIASVLKAHPEMALRLSAHLSKNEQQNMFDDSLKAQLLNTRLDSLSNALFAFKVSTQQIEKTPVDITVSTEKPLVNVKFFAR